MEIDDRTLLFKVLYMGFLDIRVNAYEEKPHIGLIRIADFLHNLSSQLEIAGRKSDNDECYKQIFIDLCERARIKNCEPWLNYAIQNIRNNTKLVGGGFRFVG